MIAADGPAIICEAAATVVIEATVSPPPPEQIKLTIDRSFVFVIRDDTTGALLFMGRIVNPAATA